MIADIEARLARLEDPIRQQYAMRVNPQDDMFHVRDIIELIPRKAAKQRLLALENIPAGDGRPNQG
jgi:hypothetical protein